ncbi:MAG: copper resistance protein NlpE [Pirellulaceae bacterium]|jgi:hypothetical protein|nr:copper resistance protein NlpE [Pirellulaceae bacterium]
MTRSFLTWTLSAATLSTLAMSFCTPSGARADDLFSRVQINSVFSQTGGTATPNNGQLPPELSERRQKVLNVGQLVDLLRDGGLVGQADGDATVTLDLPHTRGPFPVVIGLSEDREQLVVLLLLSQLDAQQTLSTDRLLALLAANKEHRPAMFSYSDSRKRIELVLSLTNQEISGRMLRDELQRLAGIAESTASLWETAPATGAIAAQPTPQAAAPQPAAPSATAAAPRQVPAAAPTQVTAAAAAGLVGRWSAARSASEAFAILLNNDGTFTLVYVKDGKQSQSKGQYSITSGQLVLTTAEGAKFSGNLTNVTTKSFDFNPTGSTAGKLTFQRAS